MKKVLAAILAAAMTASLSVAAMAATTSDEVTIGGSLGVSTEDPEDGWGIAYWAMGIHNKTSLDLKDRTHENKQYVYTYGDTDELNVVIYGMPGDADVHVIDGEVKVSTKKMDYTTYKNCWDSGSDQYVSNGSGDKPAYIFNIGGKRYAAPSKHGRVLTIKDDHGLNDLDKDDFKIEVDVDNGVTFFLNGESAYSNIREVSDDDRLANKDTDSMGCVYDFDEKITETARIRVSDYVDVYFKGNYATDKENLRIWDDRISAVEKYLDDRDVDYYDFRAHPKFASSIKVIIDADPNSILYEYKNGEIIKVPGVKYESDGWAFTTKTLGTYFATEEEYAEGSVEKDSEKIPVAEEEDIPPVSSDDTVKTNPGTGANDMAGTAAAAAVVSLLSAGAAAYKRSSK